MHEKYPHLLTPLQVGNTTFRNRIFTAPIALPSMQGKEAFPSRSVITHFANKARGGAACVTSTGVNIFHSMDDSLPVNYNVYDKKNLYGLAKLADRIHFYGAKASMELDATGVRRPFLIVQKMR